MTNSTDPSFSTCLVNRPPIHRVSVPKEIATPFLAESEQEVSPHLINNGQVSPTQIPDDKADPFLLPIHISDITVNDEFTLQTVFHSRSLLTCLNSKMTRQPSCRMKLETYSVRWPCQISPTITNWIPELQREGVLGLDSNSQLTLHQHRYLSVLGFPATH